MPASRHVAWVGLGSNLNDPARHVSQAFEALAELHGVDVLATSGLYQTTPVGGPVGQPDFCNACAAIVCACSPLRLLDKLQAIEAAHDRVRDVRWGPRTLDLDLLVYDERVMKHARLQLPHPRAVERAFVLVPLAEIAPAVVIDGARVIDHLRAIGRAGVLPWSDSAALP